MFRTDVHVNEKVPLRCTYFSKYQSVFLISMQNVVWQQLNHGDSAGLCLLNTVMNVHTIIV